MDILMIAQPNGFWENIIFWFENFINDYALTLILITLLIKIVLIPFDFINKIITKKNTRKQAILKPELDKIKKRYANNQEMQNKMTMELYKRENYSIVGTCVGMLIYMALTLTIFITLLNALNTISAYKITQEYETLKAEYTQYASLDGTASDDDKLIAEQKVVELYPEVKTGFLWIKNIWRPDTNASVVLSYDDYKSILTRVDKTNLSEEEELARKTEYNTVMNGLLNKTEYKNWNGYFLLAILSAGLTYGSTLLNKYISKRKAIKSGRIYVEDAASNNKIMLYILPVIMGIFTLLYNAAFGLYLVAGSLFSFATGPLITLLVDTIDMKNQDKEIAKTTVSYDRNKRGF